jgi:ribulose-phosphate 3-epimerase
MKPVIVPSVLSADFAHLARDVQRMEKAGAKSVQIDVMDGHFVPNITVGPLFVEAIRRVSSIFLDVHLMIENPLDYIGVFAQAGSDLLTVHWEACPDPRKAIHEIKQLGVQAGMAIRPKTPADTLFTLLPELDVALVMTVEPGFGGQAFMPEMLEKVRELRRRIDQGSISCQLQVDGGINAETAPLAAQAGATSLVAGSAIFAAPDPTKAFQELTALVSGTRTDRSA